MTAAGDGDRPGGILTPAFRTGVMRKSNMSKTLLSALAAAIALAGLLACSPTVQVAVPDKPITINLNVKIEHEIRVKVERELEDLFSKDSDLF